MELKSLGNAELQHAGVWTDYTAENGEKVRFLIAAATNPKFKEKYGKLFREATANKSVADIESSALIDLDLRASIGTIWLGWEDFTEDGEPYPFTEENAYRIATFGTLESEAIKKFILSKAQSAKTFVDERTAADLAALKSVPKLVG